MRSLSLLPLVLCGFTASVAMAAPPVPAVPADSGAPEASAAQASPATPFKESLQLQGVTFAVGAVGEGSTQLLQVRAKQGLKSYPPVRQELIGRVVEAKVADLNSDGQPEVVVVVQSAGSGGYGGVQAWSAGKRTLEPITLPDLTGPLAAGYLGHDSFSVDDSKLVRRFPLYRPGDTNARPTGGSREILYSLQRGPAGWLFQPIRVTNLPRP